MQVYNLQSDEKTKKSSAKIEYEIVNLANNQSVLHSSESTDTMGNVGDQITLEKSLSLNTFQPGHVQADGEGGRQRFQAADRAFGAVCG